MIKFLCSLNILLLTMLNILTHYLTTLNNIQGTLFPMCNLQVECWLFCTMEDAPCVGYIIMYHILKITVKVPQSK